MTERALASTATGFDGRSRAHHWFDATLERGYVAAQTALWAILAAVLTISFCVTPQDIESGRVVLSAPCSVLQVLGHACPACGMTRAFAALSHGQFGVALEHNLASPLAYALTWYGLARLTRRETQRLRKAALQPPLVVSICLQRKVNHV